jgi:hypothetical protein
MRSDSKTFISGNDESPGKKGAIAVFDIRTGRVRRR